MSVVINGENFRVALRERRQALPAELGVFIALELTEALLRRGARSVRLCDVLLDAEGQVSLAGPALACDEALAARTVHGVLLELLVAARPGLGASLLRLVEDGPAGGHWRLSCIRDELEASLVPLNRAALARVLSRLIREQARTLSELETGGEAIHRGAAVPASGSLDTQGLDNELDGWLRGTAQHMPLASASASGRPAVMVGRGVLGSAAPGTVAPVRRGRAGTRRGQAGARPTQSRSAFQDAPHTSVAAVPALRGLPEMERTAAGTGASASRLRLLLAVAAVCLAGWMWVSAGSGVGASGAPARWEASASP